MGSTPQADVPGNIYHHVMSFASRASNAADDIVPFFPPGQAIQVLSAWFVPTTSQAGSATNFDTVKLINLGAGSAGTVVLASKAFSATGTSVDSAVPGLMTLGSIVSKASTEHLGISRNSSGNGIALVAHSVYLDYRYL